MAKLDVDVAALAIDQLSRTVTGVTGAELDAIRKAVLFACADATVEIMRTQAGKARYRLQRISQKIGYTKTVKMDKSGVPSVTVTVRGNNARGQRNATVAFVLNYGRQKKYGEIKGAFYWTDGLKKARTKIPEVAEEAFARELKERGL